MNIRQCRGSCDRQIQHPLHRARFARAYFLPWGCSCPHPIGAALAQPRNTPAMSIDLRRRDDLVAAVAAYDNANPSAQLPRNAAQLLAVVFPSEDVCQRSQEDLAAEGFSRDRLSAMLRRLVEAGFLSRHRVAQMPDTYRLHLPAEVDAR
jgi:hypothetical protein